MTQHTRLSVAVALVLALAIIAASGTCSAQQSECSGTTPVPECPGFTSSKGGFNFTVGACSVASTYQERCTLGFQFGYVDGVMGAAHTPDGLLYFGSAKSGSSATCSGPGSSPDTQGMYRLYPDANNPSHVIAAACDALLYPLNKHGNLTPRGVTGPYDSDYLGGGPTMEIADGDKKLILLTYHSEFQYGEARPGLANLFFGTLGLAVSTDHGATFRKLGEIIQPRSSRKAWIRDFPDKALSIGNGPFILGDENDRPVSPNHADPEKTYIYVYYIDQDKDVCNGDQCLAVARARLADVINAVHDPNTSTVPYLFRKYYNGKFDEPAATTDPNNNIPSGRYSPILSAVFSPSIIYEPVTQSALLAYQVPNEHTIAFRMSGNLVNWDSTKPIATLDERKQSFWVRYPSLIQTGAGERNDSQLWIFYTHDPEGSKGSWQTATFMARSIKVLLFGP